MLVRECEKRSTTAAFVGFEEDHAIAADGVLTFLLSYDKSIITTNKIVM